MNPSAKFHVAALAALALAVPGVAQGAIRVHAKEDPDAPAGVTPKVVFSLTGAKARKSYEISFPNPVRGNNCDRQPAAIPAKADKHGRLTFDPVPAGFYDSLYQPFCKKTYKGQVEIVKKHFSTTVRKFKFKYPSLKISYR